MAKKTLDAELWNALEKEGTVPNRKQLQLLSGLMGEAQKKFERAWAKLSVEVRRSIIQILCEMAEADFEMDFNAIFRLSIDDADPGVRSSAIEGLWEDEDVRLVPRLVQCLQEDDAVHVRAAAAQCLAHFVLLGEVQKIRPRPFQTAYEALYATYHDEAESLDVRRRALESMAYTDKPDVAQMIQQAYAHADESMRVSAVFAMGRSAHKRWADIVLQELNSPNPEMRYEATRASGELGLQEATRTLVELTEDVDSEIQASALWSLGQIGGDLARKTLERYVRDTSNEALSEAAQDALSELEFLHSSLETFFGPPEEFSGESETHWAEDGFSLDQAFDEDKEAW